MDKEIYEIDWITGTARPVTAEIADQVSRLKQQIADLENKMQRGWWEEATLDPNGLIAHRLDSDKVFPVETIRVKCHVVREVMK